MAGEERDKMKTITLLIGFFLPLNLYALSLDEILRADKASIKLYVKEQKRMLFLDSVCKRQRERGIEPPTACFESYFIGTDKGGENLGEEFCLSASPSRLNLEILQNLKKKKGLSQACRRHLLGLEKILLYRKKDFLLPELKKYWTEQKLLP